MRYLTTCLLAVGSLALAACGGDADTKEPVNVAAAAAGNDATPVNATLTAALAGASGLGTTSGLVKSAGLDKALAGIGPYTLFAPTDDAFKALGDQAGQLNEEAMRPQAVAMLTGHIVPGYLTLQDIDRAIAAKKGPVAMRTMADGTLIFAKEGNAIAVTTKDGAKALLTGSETLASNGVIHPVSAIVAAAAPPEPATAK